MFPYLNGGGLIIHTSFQEILKSKGYIVYPVIGNSMMPLLRQRKDIVEIHLKDPSVRCKKYDVVLYQRGEAFILHRVLRVTPTGYIIAGDNNCFIENDITDEQIIGVMSRVFRGHRTISNDSFLYRLYTHLWCDCYQARMLLIKTIVKVRLLAKRVVSPPSHPFGK